MRGVRVEDAHKHRFLLVRVQIPPPESPAWRRQHRHVIPFYPIPAVQHPFAEIVLQTLSQAVFLPDKHLPLTLPYFRQLYVYRYPADVEPFLCQLFVYLLVYNLRFVKTKIFEIKVNDIEGIAHTVALSREGGRFFGAVLVLLRKIRSDLDNAETCG
jgi:hypothetical protein